MTEAEERHYRDWVRSLPCCVSDIQGETVDPHHIKGYSHILNGGGALKISSLFCIPLEHELHMELHDKGWRTFESKHNICQLEVAAAVITGAVEFGIIKIDKNVRW